MQTLHIERWTQPLFVIGLELRTDNAEAFQTIPPHWQRFMQEQVIEQIPAKLGGEIYAIYTRYANPGQNNQGTYSLVIGAASNAASAPEGLTRVELPALSYEVVAVTQGRPDLVGQAWQEIWAQDASRRSFIADFERYHPDGRMDILLGVQAP